MFQIIYVNLSLFYASAMDTGAFSTPLLAKQVKKNKQAKQVNVKRVECCCKRREWDQGGLTIIMPHLSVRALFDICLMWLWPFHLEYCQTDMRSCRFHAQAREKLMHVPRVVEGFWPFLHLQLHLWSNKVPLIFSREAPPKIIEYFLNKGGGYS